MEHPFQKRINYKGDLKSLLEHVIRIYSFDNYVSHDVVDVGYEDFNVVLETENSKYFVKLLSEFRTYKDCERYTDVMQVAIERGVSHPKLYSSETGILNSVDTSDGSVRFVVMEFINGNSFFDMKVKPNANERDFLVQQAAIINTIEYKPPYEYDSWAVINFINEFEKHKDILAYKDIIIIEPVAERFSTLKIGELPSCFVHGDIIDTNVIKSNSGKLFIVDFAVANTYPRIQELAVLLCDILLDSYAADEFLGVYDRALQVYQQKIQLDAREIEILPLYIQAAHAMHIIGSTRVENEEGPSEENDYWRNMGRRGLSFTRELWPLR